MRVLVISHTYTTPANRGKLRALAARGLDVTVGVPQRWREEGVLGRTLEVAWERQNGVEVFPVPRSEEHTSELQSLAYLVCRLLLEKKKKLLAGILLHHVVSHFSNNTCDQVS